MTPSGAPSWRPAAGFAAAVLAAAALLACYGYGSYRGARRELGAIVEYRRMSAAERVAARVSDQRDRIEEIVSTTPADARILLLDVEEPVQPLFAVRTIAYWVHPRKVFSPQTEAPGPFEQETFVASRRIDWIQDRAGLRPLGPPATTAPVPDALERALRVDVPRACAGLAAFVAYLLVVGCSILVRVAPALAPTRAGKAALSFLLGAGSVGTWLLLCFVAGLPVSATTVAVPLVPAGMLLVRAWRSGELTRFLAAGPPSDLPAPARRTAAAFACALVVGMLVLGAGRPMMGWDARMQWAHKAHAMLEEPGIRSEEFQDPSTVHFHPRYPLLVPAVEAAAMTFAASRDDGVVKVLFPLFFAAMIAALAVPLRRLGGSRTALAALAFALVPFWWGYLNHNDVGGGFTGYADLVLSALLTGAFASLLVGLRDRATGPLVLAAAFLVFAGLTKAEGKVHVVVLGLVASGWVLVTERDPSFRLRAAGLLLAPLLAVLAHELAVVQRTCQGTLPDDYGVALAPGHLIERAPHLVATCTKLFRDLFLEPRHGFLGVLLVLTVVLGRSRLKTYEFGIPMAYSALMTAAIVLPFTAMPATIYGWSAGRLVSQFLPAAWIPIALLLDGPLRRACGAEAGGAPR